MRRFGFVIVAFFVCLSANAQVENEEIVKRKLAEATSQIYSIQCDFVQTKQLKMLNDKMVSFGKMYFTQGNMLRWEYTSPYAYAFILNDATVRVIIDDYDGVIGANQSKIFKEIMRFMMKYMTGKSLADETDFNVSMSETSDEWIARMEPYRREIKGMFKTVIIRFSKHNLLATAIEMIENNNDDTLIELKNIQVDEPINMELFNID